MLYGVDPILSPDLLYTLRAMGHGDEIVIADANFPAEGLGPRSIRADGASATALLRAILPLMPLDQFETEAALSMAVVGAPDEIPPAVAEFQDTIDALAPHPVRISALERFAFYARAREAFAVVQTGDQRLYANVILKKGVIGAP